MARRSRQIVFMTLIAFLMNAILPFFATYNTPDHSASTVAFAKQVTSAPFGDRILICTGDGFKWVKWSDLQKEKKHSPTSHYKCVLCFLAAHGLKHLALFGAIALAYALALRNAAQVAYAYRPVAFYRKSTRHSRAPPAFSN